LAPTRGLIRLPGWPRRRAGCRGRHWGPGTSTRVPEPAAALGVLFLPERYWRDVLALPARIHTVSGAASIASELRKFSTQRNPKSFRVDPGGTPASSARRARTSAGSAARDTGLCASVRVWPLQSADPRPYTVRVPSGTSDPRATSSNAGASAPLAHCSATAAPAAVCR
jgi:hypothetical protein